MLSLLPMVLGAAFAGQPATVSFSCRAEPMARLVQDLGKATGLVLSVTKQCANDVLVVDVKNVPATRLLAEIAKVDAGTWTPADGGFTFTPDRVARNEEARVERAQGAAIIQSRISAELKSLQDSNETRIKAEDAARAAKARERAAGLRPPVTVRFVDFDDVDDRDVIWDESDVLQVLAGLDANRLVLQPNQKVIFSTEPNSMQSALSSRANGVLSRLVQKHDVAAERFLVQMQAEFQQGKHPSSDVPEFGLPSGSAILSGYGKADLSIATSTDSSDLEVALKFYGPDGKNILEDTATLQIDRDRGSGAGESPKAKTPVKHSALSAKILALPAELADAEQLGTSYRHVADLRAAEKILLDPERNDPLSFVVTDDLIALGESLGKQLVAVVPDEALPDFTQPDARSDSMEELGSLVKNETDGWLEIKPAKPDTARGVRIDRAALGKLIRAAESKGVPNLDDVATYANNAPPPMTSGVSFVYLSFFAPSLLSQQTDEPGGWSLYKIYGQLSPESKRELAAGAKLSIGSLGVSQKSDLAEDIFGPAPRLGLPTQNWNESSRYAREGVRPEATELLPDGIPDDGYLEMTVSEDDAFAPVDPVAEILNVYQVVGYSGILAANTSPQHRTIDAIRLVQQVTYSLRCWLTRDSSLEGSLFDNRLRKDMDVISMDNLPERIKAMLDEKAREMNLAPQRPTTVQSAPPP